MREAVPIPAQIQDGILQRCSTEIRTLPLRFTTWSATGSIRRLPERTIKIINAPGKRRSRNPSSTERDPLTPQQALLQGKSVRSLRKGNAPIGAQDAMPGHRRIIGRLPQGPGNQTCTTGQPGTRGDLRVVCHLAARNRTDRIENCARGGRQFSHRRIAYRSEPAGVLDDEF